MRNKKSKIFFALVIIFSAAAFMIIRMKSSKQGSEILQEVKPARESIRSAISTTAQILPKNRLEIKPPINGRLDSILVKEGQKVNAGETLAWISSTERAALLDATRNKGEEESAYWQEVYRPIALISPIDAEVIVATTQPGQAVNTAEPVLVLSDQLIVRAQVDEADIGKIKLGQSAIVSLDAYPDTKINAIVEHIYYESKTINNVTIYEVDLDTESTLEFFRSGMNANVGFITGSKEDALVIPAEAVFNEEGGDFVLVKNNSSLEPEKRSVILGISENKKVEVVSGLTLDDTVVIKSKKYILPKSEEAGASPFIPQRRRDRR